ncbi:hypothetical protein ACQ4LE_003924 [Meloidogyne hapla]|uniref:Craniofacial development protein 1 n=1 Tax=Meloidogyne hapla TaxID=6305 RepID=A0A1I8BFL7_MELHA
MSSEPDVTQPAADTINNGINEGESDLDGSQGKVNQQNDGEVNSKHNENPGQPDEAVNDPVHKNPPSTAPSDNASSGIASLVNKKYVQEEAVNDPVLKNPPSSFAPPTNVSSGIASSDNRMTEPSLAQCSSAKRRRISNDEHDNTPASSTSKKGGGLSSLVGSLAKKDKKQSMLAKSAQDWRQFVHEEKLEEELSTHLKSRDSFLDRQEFLLRADYKQFEHERDLRAQERKTKQPQGNAPD